MTTPRDEITHHVLRMADSGLCTRNYTITGGALVKDAHLAWHVNIDGRPAPNTAYWALTTLAKHGYITWTDLGIGIHTAIITPAGITQLRAWDDQLLGTPCSRAHPLTCLDDNHIENEAQRLINEAFPHHNKNPKDTP